MGRIPSQIFFSLNSTKRLSRTYKAINSYFPVEQTNFDPSELNFSSKNFKCNLTYDDFKNCIPT